ncbi:unnamed protein product, partial [Durusdinium trenchii]
HHITWGFFPSPRRSNLGDLITATQLHHDHHRRWRQTLDQLLKTKQTEGSHKLASFCQVVQAGNMHPQSDVLLIMGVWNSAAFRATNGIILSDLQTISGCACVGRSSGVFQYNAGRTHNIPTKMSPDPVARDVEPDQ